MKYLKLSLIILILSSFAFGSFGFSQIALADVPGSLENRPGADDQNGPSATGSSTTRQGQPINTTGLPSNLPTLGLGNERDPVKVVDSLLLNYVVNPIFFLAGGVAIIVIMYSAFRLISARGEEEGVTAAKKTLIWAAAGLALTMLAYTIVRNLANIIYGFTS